MSWGTVRREILRTIEAIVQRGDSSAAAKLDDIFSVIAAYRAAGLKEAVTAQVGTTVQAGPFQGMRFLDRVAEGAYLPKLLGSYEAELHPLIERLLATDYDAVINIGCAEGYYAVGFARAVADAMVHAYDIDPQARTLCRELSQLNGVVDRVSIAGAFAVADLDAVVGDRLLILCDIEGAEAALLDPTVSPALRRADTLVEIHDVSGRWTSDVLYPRYAASHGLTEFRPQPRNAAAYPALAALSPADQFFAMLERVEPTRWAYFEAKRS